MASTSKDTASTSSKVPDNVSDDLEPGACPESVLNPTDSFEEFAYEMSSSLQERNTLAAKNSTIIEIQSEICDAKEAQLKATKSADDLQSKDESMSASLSNANLTEPNGDGDDDDERDDYLQSPELVNKEKHVFILSTAGKPIYSRYGNEDKLAGLCGVIQALVSVVEEQNQDILRCISTKDCKAVFLVKGAVRCLPLPEKARENITNAIITSCNKIRDLVFAIMIAGNQLITLVRMKKYTLHPSDIHLLFNLVRSSESFKTAESWTPICLPKFDATYPPAFQPSQEFGIFQDCGKLDAHLFTEVRCYACLLLLTVQRDAFFPLSQAKHNIADKLRKMKCLSAINDALNRSEDLPTSNILKHIAIPEIRHFMYKCKSTAQLFTSDPICLDKLQDYRIKHKEGGDIVDKKVEKLSDIDYVTNGFELYVTFDPLMEKDQTIRAVDRLLRWIKKEEERIFIMNAPTF
ncbi:Vacuolar fusion protein MON1-like protein A [Operophtera brumata]|uniref:Vacuolar fusion protein MON1 homolog n=1 Tax=Operophtera brumata TaxID=104452 RepID=A0A0L7L5B4_OPEBR|nr:Vacuolar fusion protein MON1-like protein A [Operophtera brumata]